MLTSANVQHVAKLAKLQLDEAEMEKFTPEIQRIVEMVEHLQEVDTDGVKPTYHGNDLKNVYREDEGIKNENMDAILANAPATQDGYIQVPVIIEEGEGA